MKEKYQIEIGSPPEYEELVVYICRNDYEIALIHKDEGKEKIKIKFLKNIKNEELYLSDFKKALEHAEKSLLK